MILRSRFVMASAMLLAVLLAGLAVLGLRDIYLNQVVRDCAPIAFGPLPAEPFSVAFET